MSSPKDTKQTLPKKEGSQGETQKTNSPPSKPEKVEGGSGEKSNANAQPLAPPPKPSQQENSDYFAQNHGNTHFSLEPNPFEQSFSNPSSETPGRFGGLPSVASLTSPAPLGPGGTPGWQNSLRSGPLSPAMLPGPTPANGDYFDSSFRQSFPTPNESSLRSGLTPGGGASMFPAPSPNSQALFNSMQSGGATPGTLDFHRTAMNAAARSKSEQSVGSNQMQGVSKQDYQPAQQQQSSQAQSSQPQQQSSQQQTAGAPNPFTNNSENDAVNSLYMLASNGQRNANQFAMANQSHSSSANVAQMQGRMGNQSQDTSPTAQRGAKQSIGGVSGSTGMSDNGDYGSDASVDQKPPSKKNKKGGKGGGGNNRRKAEETPNKNSSNKKAKVNNAAVNEIEDDSDDDDMSLKDEGVDGQSSGGKKLTDEEKRKNFLERNRVAALKCRQRKKQWLANLQAKVEIFTSENDALTTQCAQLRDEVNNLKTLLFAHKDCPISHQQGLGGPNMASLMGADFEHQNPYGMAMSNNSQMMMQHQGQGMQRRS